MKMRLTSVAAIGLLVGVSACSKNNDDLPPPPPPQETAATTPVAATPTPTDTVTNTVVPGSMEEFMQQAGTDTVYFAYDSSSLDGEARDTLTKQASWLTKYPNVRITIEGHADERGTREYNLALGERRANAIVTFMQQNGIGASRVTTISYGKERPAVEGSSESAYAQNRRGVTTLSGAAAS
ncbi:peptidoglycan-associated lipoprotein Pal [Pacificimonas sp. WHA3]|uniref:Peptidoglycan-associated lipoprotein n=1 Tax=Pacificimonas pallii TaxID=2827236 RepID=A0ABS6SCZ4_9SPHN|nr:peptidoglycan-associated lipoprotein Pal [Pacificimonas pallii]MBV7256249.1 peptidoglycan-associated lipoprotein Pal [Pacificimonas pallii]